MSVLFLVIIIFTLILLFLFSFLFISCVVVVTHYQFISTFYKSLKFQFSYKSFSVLITTEALIGVLLLANSALLLHFLFTYALNFLSLE